MPLTCFQRLGPPALASADDAMAQPLLNLEESTRRHPQLVGKRFTEVSVESVQALLATECRFLGKGSFCRVWSLARWKQRQSPACGHPVVSGAAHLTGHR